MRDDGICELFKITIILMSMRYLFDDIDVLLLFSYVWLLFCMLTVTPIHLYTELHIPHIIKSTQGFKLTKVVI